MILVITSSDNKMIIFCLHKTMYMYVYGVDKFVLSQFICMSNDMNKLLHSLWDNISTAMYKLVLFIYNGIPMGYTS
jgi:hypothetical protein